MMPNMGISNKLMPNTMKASKIKLNIRIKKIHFGSGTWIRTRNEGL